MRSDCQYRTLCRQSRAGPPSIYQNIAFVRNFLFLALVRHADRNPVFGVARVVRAAKSRGADKFTSGKPYPSIAVLTSSSRAARALLSALVVRDQRRAGRVLRPHLS